MSAWENRKQNKTFTNCKQEEYKFDFYFFLCANNSEANNRLN